ncbi:ZZ-type Zinc finger-containing protein 3-like [Plakobranchus ocellatus]|uniref:ZZ-type Zinc finger-containing protein 3-like n=1 Tax=Plakobranchus ocellatus TaxID=259542 RepID=A0AAV4DDZ4_9GAST|nr:ZZ-type Zinc finger-containing protein 3-like [Plakobranchus ocellatus]
MCVKCLDLDFSLHDLVERFHFYNTISRMEATAYAYEEISEPYYFETDHAALKENSDYRSLLYTIALLEAQRQQAAKDIDALYKAQADALENPLSFVEQLQKGTDLALPKSQKIAELPDIQWEKYSTNTNFSSFGSSSQHMTRNKKIPNDAGDNSMGRLKSKLIHGLNALTNESSNQVGSTGSDSDVVVVRGRAKDKSKSVTFNQLWTAEEQQRLEHLLIQFPPEEVESRRWTKIADALGNRTAIQVASRVQKYFLRLAKEGLPIPGRMPNLSTYVKKGSHRHHRYNRVYHNSTFLQAHTPPVWMKDEDEDYSSSIHSSFSVRPGHHSEDNTPAMSETASTRDESSDEDDLPQELVNTPEYQELQRLKKLKKQMLAQQHTSATKHIGYKCDKCGCEPIVGTRWHCIDCPADMSFDFCEDCSDTSFQKDKHDSSHRLHPYKHAVLDSDYMSTSTATDYNYLDPNYMPAS